MKNVLAFGGSNSSKSINQQLATYAVSELPQAEVIKLTDFDIPMYGIDIEENEGFPADLQKLADKIKSCDGLVLSVAEHNGNLTAFLKSILDWLSRLDRKFLADTQVVILSASPGAGGGSRALAVAQGSLPFFGADVVATCSVGNFYEVFENGKITDASTEENITQAINKLK